jgi:hypothetical protein
MNWMSFLTGVVAGVSLVLVIIYIACFFQEYKWHRTNHSKRKAFKAAFNSIKFFDFNF